MRFYILPILPICQVTQYGPPLMVSGATPLGLAALGVTPDKFVDIYGQAITWSDAFWQYPREYW